VSGKFSKSKMIESKKFSMKLLMDFFHTNNIVFHLHLLWYMFGIKSKLILILTLLCHYQDQDYFVIVIVTIYNLLSRARIFTMT